jgi:UDP-N-acetylmuramoyl-L-alanyl-D-glutamate--2,6-diaminopimelate ligase
VRLAEVIAGLDGAAVVGDESVDVTRIDYDSRSVSDGSLFCCVPGANHDGHDFATEAATNGAVAFIVERPVDVALPQVLVDDARVAMAAVSAVVYGHPSETLTVVGVTGTNGKTTTTMLVANVFAEAGLEARVLGTLTGSRTTPEAPDLQRQLASWRDEGVSHLAMEVSSHALALHRVDGTRFRVAVFTNLSRDHLDFHGSMESYFEEKARLFGRAFSDAAVVNLDSPHGRLLRDASEIPTVGYSLDQVDGLEVTATSSRFRWRGFQVDLALGGRFNVSNALAAAEAAVVVGIDPATVARGLSRPVKVPGRFEIVDQGQPFTVIVDYAHTPDGLEQVLRAARDVTGTGEVAVVFGCGGERDPSKRPLMGEVAATLADRVVLTADNSRGEETGAIIAAVAEGFRRVQSRPAPVLAIEPDRRQAIRRALAAARPGDTVVIAGKGHETTQTIGDRIEPFDDRVVAAEELARIGDGEAAR